jgi:hypothetical protein
MEGFHQRWLSLDHENGRVSMSRRGWRICDRIKGFGSVAMRLGCHMGTGALSGHVVGCGMQ